MTKLTNSILIVLAILFASVLLVGISPILFVIAVGCIVIPKVLIGILKLGGCLAAGTAICFTTAFRLAGFVLKTFGWLLLLPVLIISAIAMLI